MNDRTRKELELLKEKYPSLQYDESAAWVKIPDFPLPGVWNRKETPVAFLIPPTYPQTAPDNFYVAKGLRLENDDMPDAYTEGNTPLGGEWGQFSWHPERWTAANTTEQGDNLRTFVRSIGIRLREGK